MKKRQKMVKPNETKEERFKRLASRRLTKAVKAIAMLNNLTTTNYSSTDEQRQYIVNRLTMAIEAVKNNYNKAEKKEEVIEIP